MAGSFIPYRIAGGVDGRKMGGGWHLTAVYDTIPAVDSTQIITMFPAVFLTLIFQRYIIGGLTRGAVKG